MPQFFVRGPDGGTYKVNAPDGASEADVISFAHQHFGAGQQPAAAPAAAPQDDGGGILQHAGNLVAGAVRGAGSIGATILAPYDIAKDAIAGKGLSLESNRQRRADMDAALQDLGAQPDSLMYQGGKLGTEVAGTLGVGGAVANGVGRVAPAVATKAPALLEAVRTGGFSTGSRVVPGVMNAVKDAGVRAAGGAISGAASAAAVDPADAVTGGVVGAVTPMAVKAAGAAGRTVGQAVSGRLASQAAVRKVVQAVGDDAVPQTIADIQTYYPKGAENIPVSAAAATGNQNLARLEQGSRLRSGEPWHAFDQNQGKAVFDNVQQATGEADQLAQRARDRSDNWKAAWQDAADNMKPRLWRQRMTQFGADLRQAELAPDASNPSVRGVLDAVNAEMDRLGPNFGLGHLQQLRANLNGKVQPMAPDAFKSAPRDNPAIISLKQEMDDILNTATGGKWQKVIDGYAADSEKLHAAKAASKVRGAFVDAETGRVRGVSLDPNGDVPKITEAGLGRAMDAARLPDKSLALSPDANARLTATMDALRRQNIVQGVKRSATAGSGSDTMSNAIAAGASQVGAPSLLMQALAAGRKLGMGRQDQALAEFLTSPDELSVALSNYLRPPPETNVSRALSAIYRTNPVLAGHLASDQ